MKQRIGAFLAACLLLTGCTSLLEREYLHVSPHSNNMTAEGDPSVLRADSYQELVNALIYFIPQGIETIAGGAFENCIGISTPKLIKNPILRNISMLLCLDFSVFE